MKIGIDLTLLQTAHRRRGIGYTLINFLNNLSDETKQKNEFVFYVYQQDHKEALELISLKNFSYELRFIDALALVDTGGRGRIGLLYGIKNNLKSLRDTAWGDSRIKQVYDLDYFMQFDQNQPLPKKVKSLLVLYDIIPYVLADDYLWSYKIARRKGRSRKNSLKLQAKRLIYYQKNKLNTKRASKLIAISKHTKNDFINYIGVDAKKITVCHLGVEQINEKAILKKQPEMKEFQPTVWGPIQNNKVSLRPKGYLLFVGGSDQRRKLVDLLAAFNNLKARGYNDIKLVLAGDTMTGPNAMPTHELRTYMMNSSYLDDVLFLGFITDEQRDWVYKNALAFVYPSVYEGFGLPVLEAMRYGTPVITYNNSSLTEVAGNAALMANDYKTIFEACTKLIDEDKAYVEYSKKGKERAKKFSWEKTSQEIISSIS